MRSSKRPSCSPAGSLVSTAAVIVLLAKDFLPLLLCWRGDRNYVIASAVRSGELTGACVRSRATVRDSDESDGVSVASMRGSRVR